MTFTLIWLICSEYLKRKRRLGHVLLPPASWLKEISHTFHLLNVWKWIREHRCVCNLSPERTLSLKKWKWRLTPSGGTYPASAFTFTGERIYNAGTMSELNRMLIHAGTQWMVNGHGVDLVVKWLDDSLWGGGNAESSGAGGEFHISPTFCCAVRPARIITNTDEPATQHQNKEAKRPILTKHRVYIRSIQGSSNKRSCNISGTYRK